jgi:RNA polymerase sigma-70 factor (ECF subfamily)
MSAHHSGQDQHGSSPDYGDPAIIVNQDLSLLLDQLYRNHFGKMVAVLMYHTGIEKIEISEDIVQEAFAIASEKWQKNIPDKPEAWLYATIRNIAFNNLKKEKQRQLIEYGDITPEPEPSDDQDLLKVLFACLQPAFSPKVQLIIVLRYVCGLRVKRIAALLASNEDSVSKILYRWRAQITPETFKLSEISHTPDEQKIRMALKILYVMFTEGYQLSENGNLTDEALCEDALSLLKEMMKMHIDSNGNVKALYALMLYNLARADSRINQLNELTVLAEQDRGRWNREMIAVANHYLFQSQKESSIPSAYQLEAAIAYKHTSAAKYEETDWVSISGLYEKLVQLNPSPFTKLGQAAALYFGGNEPGAVKILIQLNANPFFQHYHLIHCFWAKIYGDKNDTANALVFYKKALTCQINAFERKFIEEKIRKLSKYEF